MPSHLITYVYHIATFSRDRSRYCLRVHPITYFMLPRLSHPSDPKEGRISFFVWFSLISPESNLKAGSKFFLTDWREGGEISLINFLRTWYIPIWWPQGMKRLFPRVFPCRYNRFFELPLAAFWKGRESAAVGLLLFTNSARLPTGGLAWLRIGYPILVAQ